MAVNGKKYSVEQGYTFARRYCSQQERARKDVKDKLIKNGLEVKEVEKILNNLTEEGFLSEQRYADLYVQSKVRQSHWGRIKIRNMLIAKQVPIPCINSALAKIDPTEYEDVLCKLMYKKINNIKTDDQYQRNYRLRYYLSSHGFENDLIDQVLEKCDVL